MRKNGPWKIKNSQEKYKNPWMRVREDSVIRPDGKDGIYGIVEMLEGVCVLPIDDNGYAYLTEQFRYTIEKNSLEVASGSIEKDEAPLDAAKRELKEETGIIADEWINMGIIYPITTAVKALSTLYLARNLQFGESNPDSTEHFNIIKIKFDDVAKMVMENKLNHGPSCVLILKALEYLK